jgi:arylsulfatase A-like enzyme
MKNLAVWCTQLVCIVLGIGSVRVALVERTRSIVTPMPKAELTESASSPSGQESARSAQKGIVANTASAAWGVAYRLIDHIGEAELNSPAFDEPRIAGMLKGYWRRLHSPFVGPQGNRGRLIQQIGIASNQLPILKESELDDGHWHADPKLWGLDEGTYDQREAIVAPAPTRIVWHLRLQERSRFETSIAAFAGEGVTQFEIAIVADGTRHALAQKQVSQSHAWDELTVDLSAFRGEVALELTTSGRDASLAAWGSPIVVSPGATPLPYNVLFFVVDAMRSDALSTTHDVTEDRQRAKAELAPFDAWLPRMPEVAPNLDRLASQGIVFSRAWSAAMWTRPSTLAMLTGMRAGRLGMPVLELEPRPAEVKAFYASNPPLWPLLMRSLGAHTRAIINNMYLCGYVGVGVDTGFESMTDHRYQLSDTEKITADTVNWLGSHRDDRFALFVNYVSPHAPYNPESRYLDPIEHAASHPENRQVRRYLGEIRKDDEAIGRILEQVERLGLTSKTLIVVTADHGETLSEAHDWVAVDVAKGVHSGRFTHLSTMWEEAARVPIVFSLPGVIPASSRNTQPVQTTDILPTLLDVLGVEIPKNIDGVSLKPLFSKGAIPERAALIEGRGATSIIDGQWHYVQRSPIARQLQLGSIRVEKSLELYDLLTDPGERHDISSQRPEIVARLKNEVMRRLEVPRNSERLTDASRANIHVRVSTGAEAGVLSGNIKVATGRIVATSSNSALAITSNAPNVARVEVSMPRGSLVDLDLTIEPANSDIDWNWQFADKPWPKTAYYVGPLGIGRNISEGLRANEGDIMVAAQAAYVVRSQEQGIFVTRDSASEADTVVSQAAQVEAQQAMQAWGYVRRNESAQKHP